MRLKNRFKNRFVSYQSYINWCKAKDFRASVIGSLAEIERKKYQNA